MSTIPFYDTYWETGFDYCSCSVCKNCFSSYDKNTNKMPYSPTYYFCSKRRVNISLSKYYEWQLYMGDGDCFEPNEEFEKNSLEKLELLG
jgi:hypothetical protein